MTCGAFSPFFLPATLFFLGGICCMRKHIADVSTSHKVKVGSVGDAVARAGEMFGSASRRNAVEQAGEWIRGEAGEAARGVTPRTPRRSYGARGAPRSGRATPPDTKMRHGNSGSPSRSRQKAPRFWTLDVCWGVFITLGRNAYIVSPTKRPQTVKQYCFQQLETTVWAVVVSNS